MTANTLAALGWTDELEAAMTIYSERGFEPARVVAEHRGGYYVRGECDDRLASARGNLRGLANADIVESALARGCLERGPYEVILLNGSVPAPPQALIAQLK